MQWQIERSDNPAGYRVHAHNSGETRVRLVGLELHDAAGVLRARRDGLVGYVLGRSHVSFVIPELASDGGAAATALRLSVRTETDPIKTDLLPVTGSP